MTPLAIALDFTLRQGAFTLQIDAKAASNAVAIFGPSGSGKTTVLEAIAGLRRPERGEIRIGSRVLFSAAGRIDVPVRLRRVGYVPQDVALFPHLDVRRNILYGAAPGAAGDVARVLAVLEIGSLIDRPSTQSLSGGERQRVAVARALMCRPQILLLDEPLAAVDLARRRRIVDCLQRVRHELSVPIVYVSHDPAEVSAMADWVIVLEEGRVAASGPPASTLPHV
jgi:molybdate transport system ATP-binding protein